jgi:hypothetical protein
MSPQRLLTMYLIGIAQQQSSQDFVAACAAQVDALNHLSQSDIDLVADISRYYRRYDLLLAWNALLRVPISKEEALSLNQHQASELYHHCITHPIAGYNWCFDDWVREEASLLIPLNTRAFNITHVDMARLIETPHDDLSSQDQNLWRLLGQRQGVLDYLGMMEDCDNISFGSTSLLEVYYVLMNNPHWYQKNLDSLIKNTGIFERLGFSFSWLETDDIKCREAKLRAWVRAFVHVDNYAIACLKNKKYRQIQSLIKQGWSSGPLMRQLLHENIVLASRLFAYLDIRQQTLFYVSISAKLPEMVMATLPVATIGHLSAIVEQIRQKWAQTCLNPVSITIQAAQRDTVGIDAQLIGRHLMLYLDGASLRRLGQTSKAHQRTVSHELIALHRYHNQIQDLTKNWIDTTHDLFLEIANRRVVEYAWACLLAIILALLILISVSYRFTRKDINGYDVLVIGLGGLLSLLLLTSSIPLCTETPGFIITNPLNQSPRLSELTKQWKKQSKLAHSLLSMPLPIEHRLAVNNVSSFKIRLDKLLHLVNALSDIGSTNALTRMQLKNLLRLTSPSPFCHSGLFLNKALSHYRIKRFFSDFIHHTNHISLQSLRIISEDKEFMSSLNELAPPKIHHGFRVDNQEHVLPEQDEFEEVDLLHQPMKNLGRFNVFSRRNYYQRLGEGSEIPMQRFGALLR